jgi:hypothetical protein
MSLFHRKELQTSLGVGRSDEIPASRRRENVADDTGGSFGDRRPTIEARASVSYPE